MRTAIPFERRWESDEAANERRGDMTRRIEMVTFRPTGEVDVERSTRMLRGDDEGEGEFIQRATRKIYGARCFWWSDSGLGLHYGQVMTALRPTAGNSNPGNSSRTYRMRVDIETVHS
jgi:hypothetical protein